MSREWPMNNRDLGPMLEIFDIVQNVRSLQRRRDFEQEQMYSITQHLTGMPGGGKSTGYDERLGKIEELSEEHLRAYEEYAKRIRGVERALNGIEDEKMRAFVQMFYIDRIGASEIRKELEMGERWFLAARKAIETAEDMKSVKWPDGA